MDRNAELAVAVPVLLSEEIDRLDLIGLKTFYSETFERPVSVLDKVVEDRDAARVRLNGERHTHEVEQVDLS